MFSVSAALSAAGGKRGRAESSLNRKHSFAEVVSHFAATSRSRHQAKVDSRSGSGPNLNRRPVISKAITRT